jgi:diguanylate cyclase (GGDEF)-like protein
MAGGREKLFWIPFGLGLAGLVAYSAFVAVGQPVGLDRAAGFVYDGTLFMAAFACLTRALVPSPLRVAWIAFGAGLLSWAAGDVYWTQVLADLEEIPYPSLADAGYLVALPCFFVGIAWVLKTRVGQFTLASWLDGTTAALAAAAVGTAVLAPILIGLTEGDATTVLVNLAYPLGDVILVAFLLGALVVTGLRGSGSILILCAGLLTWGVADSYYLYIEGTSGWVGGWPDTLWLVGALLIAASALPAKSLRPRRREVYRSSMVPPVVATLTATAVLVLDHFERTTELSIWLAGAAIAASVIRLTVSYRENDRLVHALHGEAVTDQLTGLPNRRHLMDDLGAQLHNGHTPKPAVFAMFDLDGFKHYNDSFGHPAGDALLERLGHNMSRTMEGIGTAYRLGGDEFCVLAEPNGLHPGAVVERARAALSERGEGFTIGASAGWVVIPTEAASTSEALRAADQRMYKEKGERSTRSAIQTQELLMRILRDREPELGEHVDHVCKRAMELGRILELDEDVLDTLKRAAQLHDIGKIAIPDDILGKPGPLDPLEWRLMKRHTLIGERILGAAPGMKEIGQIVRSSHERWDGTGYPDGLKGEEIPLTSRIIFVADALDAMCSDRPYKGAMTQEQALEELRRNAGGQFDPGLVETLCALVKAKPDGQCSGSADGNGARPARNGSAAEQPSMSSSTASAQ